MRATGPGGVLGAPVAGRASTVRASGYASSASSARVAVVARNATVRAIA